MNLEWSKQVIALIDRDSEADDNKFVSLVDQAIGKCDYNTCHILLRTFTVKNDYGIQDAVINVLASAKKEDYYKALLEELPRLVKEASNWVESLIGSAIDSNPQLFVSAVSNTDNTVK